VYSLKVDIAEHLEKWGCDHVVTKAEVHDLLKLLGHHVKNGKVEITDLEKVIR
jgi:hypothetical protein